MDSLMARTRHTCIFPVLFSCCFGVIFIFCDLCYYGVLTRPPCRESNCSLPGTPSVKLMMQDHMGHYVHHYGAELFEKYTRVSQVPFVTPNLITFMHLCVAFVAAYLVGNELLFWRRVGIFLFQVRFFLDMLDGAVFRAQHNQHMMVNGWGTWGYLIDGGADIVAGVLLVLGLYNLLHHNPPKQRDSIPLPKGEKSRGPGDAFSMEMPVRRSMINMTLGLVLFQGLLRSMFWDRYQFKFYHMLQTKLVPPGAMAMQAHVFNSPLTRFILWCWKCSSADGMVAFVYLGIFLDCVWAVISTLRRYGFIQIAVLVVVSQLLVWQMEELLPMTLQKTV